MSSVPNTSSYPDLSFLNPGQGPLHLAPPLRTGPQGQPGWTPNTSIHPSSPGFGGVQAPFSLPGQGGQNPPTMMDQAWLAFLNDYGRMQGAADTQHSQVQGLAGAVNTQAQTGGGAITEMADSTGRDLFGLINSTNEGARRDSQDLNEFAGGIDSWARGGNPAMETSIQGAYRKADQAEAGFQQGIQAFQDRGAIDASSVSAGIQARAASQIQQIKSGIHPDGSPMTPQEQEASIYRVQQDTQMEVADNVTKIYDNVNNTLVGLQAQLASLREQGAQTRIAGGGLQAQERQTETQAEGIAAGLKGQAAGITEAQRQLSGQLGQVMAQIKNAGVLNAANLMVQGREAMATFIQNNPQSIISLFSGLTAMLGLASAPNVGGLRAATVPGIPALGGRPR